MIVQDFHMEFISECLPNEPDDVDLLPHTTYPASIQKRGSTYIATTANGHNITLQQPYSDVQVEMLNGTHGTLTGHIELDPLPYLKYIPENECIITAIPNFTFSQNQNIEDLKPRFRIKIRHIIGENGTEEDLKHIHVRHGDIRHGIFTFIPHKDNNSEGSQTFWEADINYITITTTHFSQFLCTSCKTICDTRLMTLVSGAVKEFSALMIAECALFVCPLQFSTKDYKLVRKCFNIT